MHRIFILAFFLIFSNTVYSQFQGKVYDAENQDPIEGVMISTDGNVLTISDKQGKFYLNKVNISDTLVFERIGYQKRQIVVGRDSVLNISLKSKSIAIEDVIIRAYDTRQEAFKSPGALEVLNAEQINRISVTSPESVLNSMPGIYMHKGARNTNRITIRGIGSRSMYTTTKIKAYLNEIPLTSGIGETTLEDLDLDLMGRITVLKGPSSSIYGSALGGTILYRMGMPAKKGLTVRQKSSIGSFRQFQNTSQVNWKGDKSGLRIAYNKLKSDGFRSNDDYNRDALTTYFEHHLSEDIKISYLGRYHNLKAYIPSSLSEETFQNNPASAAENWKQVNGHETYEKWLNGLSLNMDFNNNWSLASSIFVKHYNGKEVRPFNILDDRSITSGTRNLLRWNTEFSEIEITSHAGFESLYETYHWNVFETLQEGEKGEKLSKNEQQRVHQNFFGSLELEWGQWSLSTGMNLNKTRYSYNDLFNDSLDFSDQKNFDWIISPRISLNWQPTEQLIIFSNLSHGYSTPSYEETLNAEGYVTGSVKPETGWTRELGLRMKDKNHRWFFKISGYSVAVNDLLVTKRLAEDEFYKINAGKTLHQGIETLGRVQWLNHSIMKSTFHISYMFADYQFEEFTDEGNDYSGNALPGVPKHKAHVQLDVDFDAGFYITGNMILSDAMPMNDANNKYSGSYTKTDIRIGFQKTLSRKWHLDVYTGIQNMTDNDYTSMILINAPSFGGAPPRYYYPAEPRNYIIGLSVRRSIF